MSKHLIRQLDRDIDTLRSQVWYLNDILDKINDWLEEEIEHNEPVLNGNEELSDDTLGIHEGRSECATSLLEQIKKWENEDDE
tara:strand:+ start:399 stop:647 length:249 start_codon:yes stop_codon:yes gene_type:complete